MTSFLDTINYSAANEDSASECRALRLGPPDTVLCITGSGARPLSPVANEVEAVPGAFVLTAAYPNPFADRARFTLEVAEAQDVRVTVYDVMGREVIRLHDGLLAAGTRHAFEVDGRALASGVYLIRVDGEHFAETQRLTVLR